MITIYHNPRCSKSRQALELLESRGIAPEVVLYLDTPPTAKALDALLKKLGMQPRDVMRKKEQEYVESGADDASLSRAQLIEKIVQYPKLLERPIVVKGDKAAIGRPPENILDIL